MLIKYIRNDDGEPVATIVAIGANQVGVSVCSERDTFCKCFGKLVASERARAGISMPEFKYKKHVLEALEYYGLFQELGKMIIRSQKYFNKRESINEHTRVLSK